MPTYPAGLPSFTTNVDFVDDVLAADMNSVQDEIVAIATELGTDPAGSVTDVKTRLARALDGNGNLDFATSTELTIATGSITPTQNWHTVDTESDAASDDLDTIVASSLTDGFVLLLRPNNDSRTVVVKHDTGNILCVTGLDYTLDDQRDLCLLIYDATLTKWIAMSVSGLSAASLTLAGIIEIATAAETTTGTDATRAVSPDGLAGSDFGKRVIAIQVLDGATAWTTGDGKAYVRVPSELNGYNVVGVAAGCITTSSSGTPTVQIARGRQTSSTDAHSFVDVLSTRSTIDAGEYDSKDAATPAVINGSNDDLATGDILRVDIDVAGTGTAGLNLNIICQLP